MKTKQSKTLANAKLSYKEFVERSIKTLRVSPHKGIHVVYSNFNAAFRQYYNEEPRPIIDKLVAEGFLVSRPSRGGVTIALASECDDSKTGSGGSAALAKLLSQD